MAGSDIPDTIGHGSRVQQFYAGQSVFVTGGTGFLGKLLLEKLLRTCRDVKAVYVMVRPKKGENAAARAERLFKDCVFDRLKKEVPHYQEKVRVISGDCSLPHMGLSAADIATLTQQVTIVFNVAATTRFNEKLKQAIAINVRGVDELLKLCTGMPNLLVVMQVSTAYSNCNRQEIDERFYDPPITASEALRLLQRPAEEMDAFEESQLGSFPNTYVYSKCIGESVARDYSGKLPIGLFRPAIVLTTYNDPMPGWTDNAQGPTGGIVAIQAGVLRTFMAAWDYRVELIPADYSTNILLAAAWEVATAWRANNEAIVYNFSASGCGSKITWGEYLDQTMEICQKEPDIHSLWYHRFSGTSNVYLYFVLRLILHTLPALLIDIVMLLLRRKPMALNMYKRLHKFADFTKHFCLREWEFGCGNTMRLWRRLGSEDRALFPFSMEGFHWEDFFEKYIRGIKVYLLKDYLSAETDTRKQLFMFNLAHRAIMYGMGLVILYPLFLAARHVISTWIVAQGA